MIRMHDYNSEIDELERGDTISVCHMGCPAGEDIRYRLYLTKPAGSPNVVLGYCHNCNESGVLKNSDDTPYRDFNHHRGSVSKQVKFDVPANMVKEPNLWPNAALAWRINKKLGSDQCKDYGIQYDPSTHRIYLPIYKHMDDRLDIDLIGYQLRQLDGNAPKYLTAQIEQDTILYTVIRPIPKRTTSYVLVEDFASGIAVADAVHDDLSGDTHHIGVIVNYGVKVKLEALNDCPNILNGYVWLDNDGEHILQQSVSIAKTWGLVTGVHIQQNLYNSDPKQYSQSDILNILKEDGLWSAT